MTNIDVRESVTVNDIVPVTLTEEERLDVVKKQINETSNLNKSITLTLLNEAVPSDLFEKVELANNKSGSLLVEVSGLIDSEAYDLAKVEELVVEAYDLAKDASKILDANGIRTIESDAGQVDGSATGTVSVDGTVSGTTTIEGVATTTRSTTTDTLPDVAGASTSTATATEETTGTSSEEVTAGGLEEGV